MDIIGPGGKLLALLVLLALVGAGCGSTVAPGERGAALTAPPAPSATPAGRVVATARGQYRDISPAEFRAMLEHKDFFHVDVHVPHEGRLPAIDARIPFDQIAQRLDELPADKTAKIVVTCRSDRMSTIASGVLADLGYTNVYNLDGGFNAWRDAGYPFSPEETPTP